MIEIHNYEINKKLVQSNRFWFHFAASHFMFNHLQWLSSILKLKQYLLWDLLRSFFAENVSWGNTADTTVGLCLCKGHYFLGSLQTVGSRQMCSLRFKGMHLFLYLCILLYNLRFQVNSSHSFIVLCIVWIHVATKFPVIKLAGEIQPTIMPKIKLFT